MHVLTFTFLGGQGLIIQGTRAYARLRLGLMVLMGVAIGSAVWAEPDDDFPNDPLAKGSGLQVDSVWSGIR